MSVGRISYRYARAVLDFALENNASDAVYADMNNMVEVIESSEDLRSLLSSPLINLSAKKKALQSIFPTSNTTSFKAIDLLIENKRLNLLNEVSKQYVQLFDQSKGKQSATVTTAFKLDDALTQKVLDKVKELTGKEATLTSKIDPSIIGGFILRVGDQQYDSSISNHFNNIRRQFN